MQCLLTHNLYLEHMYVFLWYWMIFVLICSFVTLLMWIIRSVTSADRAKYIEKHLLNARAFSRGRRKELRHLVREFTYSYLRFMSIHLLLRIT